jgi:hypothetical protein
MAITISSISSPIKNLNSNLIMPEYTERMIKSWVIRVFEHIIVIQIKSRNNLGLLKNYYGVYLSKNKKIEFTPK